MTRPDDRHLLRLVRQHLDVDALLAAHSDVSRADLDAFWARQGLEPPARPRPRDLFDSAPAASPMPGGLKLVARCDGAARGNPGPAAIGVVIQDAEGDTLLDLGECIGEATCNVAEYTAVIRAVEQALALRATDLLLLLDSELLVHQLRGSYKVKAPHLRPLHGEALRLLSRLKHWEVRHVPRAQNAAADALANQALDGKAR